MRGSRGQTLVEFAIAASVFFATIFGTIEFGLAIWQYNMMSNLAQEGARYAQVHGLNSGSSLTSAQIQTWVRSRAVGISGVNVTTTPDPPGDPGTIVTVIVTHDFTPETSFIPNGTLTLSSTARMIVSR